MADYGLSRRRRSTATEGGDLEAGISGGVHSGVVSSLARRWTSYAAIGSYTPLPGGSTGARFFFDCGLEDEPRHFLDACFLCNKPLGRNRDIYMYRGDIPFCSEECRLEQIEMDEAREKSRSLSMRASSSRKEQQISKEKASSTGIEAQTAGAVVAV